MTVTSCPSQPVGEHDVTNWRLIPETVLRRRTLISRLTLTAGEGRVDDVILLSSYLNTDVKELSPALYRVCDSGQLDMVR